MNVKYIPGWIEVIIGPMFSGKSAEIIARAKSLKHAKKNFLVFKPKLDNRWNSKTINSRNGTSFESIILKQSRDIFLHLSKHINIKVLLFDEIQFFDKEIVDILDNLANDDFRIIVAGLDRNFRGKSFFVTSNLLAISEIVTKLTAICFKCGKTATHSKRITTSKKLIDIGNDNYEARCRKCYSKD